MEESCRNASSPSKSSIKRLLSEYCSLMGVWGLRLSMARGLQAIIGGSNSDGDRGGRGATYTLSQAHSPSLSKRAVLIVTPSTRVTG